MTWYTTGRVDALVAWPWGRGLLVKHGRLACRMSREGITPTAAVCSSQFQTPEATVGRRGLDML